MNPADRALAIAARIADGSAIDWPDAETSPTGPADPAIIEELKAIAALATLHRAPSDWLSSEVTQAGKQWGPLTFLAPVAEGRFGQVYRAWDARLQRQVALKLLHAPSSIVSGSQTHAIEEARLLARVRHPNVLTVHGAECLDGQVGIWTEFIEGRTLEDLLAERGTLPSDEVVAIGVDLCRALAAVHEAGLLHRDVKSQNVMRETGGRIVLMDFGTGHDVELVPASAGDLSGTPLYLAPELFAGGRPTVASDIYALGVLLFRLVTGDYPVPGRTLDDVRAGHRDSRMTRLRSARPDLPAALVEAIERGLLANPSQRFENAHAFEAALLQAERMRSNAASTSKVRRLHPAAVATIAALVVATASLTYALRNSVGVPSPNLAISAERLTFTDDASLGVISPDGSFVAYVRPDGPRKSLWLQKIATRTDVLIATMEPDELVKAITITPDNTSLDVLVMKISPRSRAVWRVPIARGGRWKILTNVGSPIGWSPDGRHLAFVRIPPAGENPERVLVVADSDGSNQRVLAHPHPSGMFLTDGFTDGGPNRPVWSPDGSAIALLSLPQLGMLNEIDVFDTISGASRYQRTIDGAFLSELAWLDDTRLVVNRHEVQGGPFELWDLDLRTGASTPITRDVADYRGVTLTADRQLALSTRTDYRAGVWLGGPAGEDMKEVVKETAANPRWPSFDGRGTLAYEASTDSGRSIWTLASARDRPQLVLGHGSWPALTPDGRIVYAVDGLNSRGQELWVTNGDGSHPVRIAEHGIWHAVTPDGGTVYFISTGPLGFQDLWSVRTAGGPPRLITDRWLGSPLSVSSDGRRVMFSSSKGTAVVLVVCDLPDCSNEETSEFAGFYPRFTPDGTGVAYLRRDDTANIWIRSFAGGPPRPLTHFADRTITGFAWSQDGKTLAVTRQTSLSNIVLLKGIK